jgi:hypothetical protein
MSASSPTSNSPLHPVRNTSSQHLSVAPGSQCLAQTQFAHLEETVRNFYDIIPENLFKIPSSENNEIFFDTIHKCNDGNECMEYF